jgi:uncharacterized protein YndB with AHSA1/START domain
MSQIIFQRQITIDAPLAHVWQLVATETGLRQWWGNPISLEAAEGGRCEEWRFERNKPVHWQGKVTMYAPPHQLTLTLQAQEPEPGWPALTSITIALEAKGEGTSVHVTHRALATAAVTNPASVPQPIAPGARLQQFPTAQLGNNAPSRMPSYDAVQPTHTLLTPQLALQQSDLLAQRWHARLTSLATLGSANIQKIAA